MLNTCNTTGRYPPTFSECAQYLNQTNPFLVSLLLLETNAAFNWIQFFSLPRSGPYTVTIAGAGGGKGACSRHPGRGVVIQMQNVTLEDSQRASIFVGQKGTSACDTNPFHPVCQLNETSEGFEDECVELLLNSTTPEQMMFDGGGGGGGETTIVIQTEVSVDMRISAGGGGGASAIFSNKSRDFGDSTIRAPVSSSRMNGVRVGMSNRSAGAGGAFGLSVTSLGNSSVDGNQEVPGVRGFSFYIGGGEDCLPSNMSVFPNTVGGFGGGGGGCGNGGGGGGFWGGNVSSAMDSNMHAGGGGAYYVPDGLIPRVIGFNNGAGYVTFFFERCSCVYECMPDFENEVFECVCPDSGNVSLAPDGKDCIESR